jgi:6-pyruvoyl-tetrahydropterin synthase related domain
VKRRFIAYLPLAALVVLAVWPILRAGPPGAIDGPNHFYRFVELDWHVRHGDFYPRWFADVHDGFGGPILNFYAPLSYYLLVVLRLVIGSFSNTYLAGFVLAVAGGIIGMYAWARSQFGSQLAALVAATAYAFMPHFYVTALVRGSWPEVCALAIVPWLFWAALRLIRQASWFNRLTLTLLYAVLMLTHSLSALLFTPLLIGYSLVSIWRWPDGSKREHWMKVAVTVLALGTAILIAAFFLIPFVAEAPFVQLQRAGVFDYHVHFISLGELFSAPVQYDPNYITHNIPDSLPWPQLALGLVAVGAIFVKRSGNRLLDTLIVVSGVGAVVLAFLAQPGAAKIWEAFPFAYLIQLPGRLLSPAALLLAWLSGAAIAVLPVPQWRWPVTPVAVIGIFFFTLTWSFSDFNHYADNASPLNVIKFEMAYPDSLGTTGSQEFVPRWVAEMPAPDTLLGHYTENEVPFRLAPVPEGVSVSDESASVTATDFHYESAQAFTANFYLFYFPGWAATVDGKAVAVKAAENSGWVAVDLPAGQHAVHLGREATPPQGWGMVISLLGLALLFVPFGLASKVGAKETAPVTETLSPAWVVILIGLLVVRVAVFDRIESPFSASELDSVPNPVAVNFGDQLNLLGVRYPEGPTLVSGGALDLTLYWQAAQAMKTRYSTSVQLVDAYGNRFGQTDHFSPADVPTPWWPVGKYARDEHTLRSLAGTPPGDYHLWVSVYSGDTGQTVPLNVLGADGSVKADYDLGAVTVTRAVSQAAGPLRLVTGSLAADSVNVGDRLPFTLTWNSGDAPLSTLDARMQFTDAKGKVIFTTSFPPAGSGYSTEQWSQNELILFPQSVLLPPDLPAGPVQVTLALVKPDGAVASEIYTFGKLTIVVPERTFTVPTMAFQVGYDFNGAIRLLGYDLAENAVTFYWQALRPVPVQLTVFVHHFATDGTFDAGNDSPPARSTTSWLPGEVIADVHPIAVGDNFEVGLYDTSTGERFGDTFMVKP